MNLALLVVIMLARLTRGQSETAKPARTKPQNEGEKLVVRRLPPAMTEAEFISILGPEWELSKGKVDWFSYAAGKISKECVGPIQTSHGVLTATNDTSKSLQAFSS